MESDCETTQGQFLWTICRAIHQLLEIKKAHRLNWMKSKFVELSLVANLKFVNFIVMPSMSSLLAYFCVFFTTMLFGYWDSEVIKLGNREILYQKTQFNFQDESSFYLSIKIYFKTKMSTAKIIFATSFLKGCPAENTLLPDENLVWMSAHSLP